MTSDDRREFKELIKEGTLEVLTSSEGRKAIKEGSLDALRSEEGKDLLLENFVEAFHDVVVPVFEQQVKRFEKIEEKVFLKD